MKAAAAAAAALLALAVLVQDASPGFLGRLQSQMTPPQQAADSLRRQVQSALPELPKPPKKKKRKKKRKPREKARPPVQVEMVGCKKPKRVPRGIPRSAFNLYVRHAGCDWWVVAGVYMVESSHGTSNAPGVKSGVNRAGCCRGPGQFNQGGTMQRYGLNLRTVYMMEHTVPATVRMLRDNGLGTNVRGYCQSTARTYGVPTGTANALWHYNHACWYVAGTLAPGLAYYRQATR